jgi:uncharacterized NAD-dependent epimerase/dehydratase family protein
MSLESDAPGPWAPPFLLYLGDAADDLAAKTARGLAQFRPQWCAGQFRGPQCRTTVGLPDMDFVHAHAVGVRTLVIGLASAGGRLSPTMVDDIVAALAAGLDVASGLHERLAAHPTIAAAAQRHGRRLFEVRMPPPDLPVGTGRKREGRRLLTVGTDCSTGKMVTALILEAALRARGVPADFRATGQTGILIAGRGIAIDALVADFISGGVEALSPARNDGGWDVIEGQGSLFHASFAGVALGLLHGAQPDALVLCHTPGRQHMRGLPHMAPPDLAITLEANLAAARLTNPRVQAVGIALNTSALSDAGALRLCRDTEQAFALPTCDPLRHGATTIIDKVLACCPG